MGRYKRKNSRGGKGGNPPKQPKGLSRPEMRDPESGLTGREENRLISKVLHFSLDMDGMDKAIRATKRNMDSEDGRTSNGAVKNWITMVEREDKLRATEELQQEVSEIKETVNEFIRSKTGTGATATGGASQDPGPAPPA